MPKQLEIEILPKRLDYATKLQNFTVLAMYFSSQTDKYSIIYPSLKIKFLGQQFQNFQTKFVENSQVEKLLKMRKIVGFWSVDDH